MLRRIALSGAALSLIMLAGAGRAPAADFYQGRTLTIVVSAAAGGNYGLYAQVLARHLGRHIPGNPTVITQFMAGSGGMKAANFVDNAAPKDGTVVSMPLETVPLSQFTSPTVAKFNILEWQWVGNMTTFNNGITVWHTAPATTFAEAKTKQVIVGASGKGSVTYIIPELLNKIFGTQFKIIPGYTGIAPIDAAMEQGEVQGRAGAFKVWRTMKPEWVSSRKVIPIIQLGLVRDADLPDVPLGIDEAKGPMEKSALEFLALTTTAFGRSIYATAGVPAEQVDILRRAFVASMRDQRLVDDIKKQGADIDPVGPDELKAMSQRIANVDPAVLTLFQSILK